MLTHIVLVMLLYHHTKSLMSICVFVSRRFDSTLSLPLVPITLQPSHNHSVYQTESKTVFWIWISPADTRANAPRCLPPWGLANPSASALVQHSAVRTFVDVCVYAHMFLISHSDSSLHQPQPHPSDRLSEESCGQCWRGHEAAR